MKRPTPIKPSGEPLDDELERLIAVCLELYEGSGPRAVDEMLAAHPGSSERVRERLDLLSRMGLVGEAPEEALPERIGAYAVHGVLGRGGMGVVYEAEQEHPRRRVAIKMLRAAPGPRAEWRFRYEAELLGRLQHPGIAKVYEVGSTTLGGMRVPFIAMELVHGETLDRYVARHALGLRERLELLACISDAVHHAHQKGVVHRDLKPANVLVDERGAPRVLDFGIGRMVDPDLELSTMRTRVGQLVGTLHYMSPEQAAGDPSELDSRCDVYALGVIGYEMLSGRLPHRLDGRPVLEALEAIRTEEPPRLASLDRRLRGDLDTIIATAIAKEKERRYSSANELAGDLRRHLANEPISARPATAAYHLIKLARRHRVIVTGVGATALVLALGLAVMLAFLRRAAAEQADAVRRFEMADAAVRFQRGMFATADPARQGLRVVDLLDRAARSVEDGVAEPLAEAAVRFLLGEDYLGIGEWERAEPLVAAAAETFERELGPADLQSLDARTRLSRLYVGMGRLDDAEVALGDVVRTATRAHGEAHDVTLSARLARASLLRARGAFRDAVAEAEAVAELAGRERRAWFRAKRLQVHAFDSLGDSDAALAAARDAADWHVEAYGERHPESLSALETLGATLILATRAREAEPIVRRVYELQLETLGEEHPDTLKTLTNLGDIERMRGELEKAEELLRRAAEIARRRLPPRHPTLTLALNNLGLVLAQLREDEEAGALFREVLEIETKVRGPEHPRVIASTIHIAETLLFQRQFEEAEGFLTEALDLCRLTRGDEHPETLYALMQLATLRVNEGRFAEADPLLEELVEAAPGVLGEQNYRVGLYRIRYGENLGFLRRFEEAEEEMLAGLDVLERLLDEHDPQKAMAFEALSKLYRFWGRPEDAAFFDERLREL